MDFHMVGYRRYCDNYWVGGVFDMQITGTREAFMKVVSEPGFAGRSGISKSTVSQWAKGDRVPTLDKMEEVLAAAGATVVQEKVWEIAPNDK